MTEPLVGIVGAGPAGLAAAVEASAAGARVLIFEERPALGGRAMVVPGARGLTEGLMRDLGASRVWRNSPVWGLFGRTLAVCHGDRTETITADAVILATGAPETMLPFRGWTLGGVMTVEVGWESLRAGRIGHAAGPAIVAGTTPLYEFAGTTRIRGGPGSSSGMSSGYALGEAGGLAGRLAERGIAVAFVGPTRPPGMPENIPHHQADVAAAEGAETVERVVLTDGAVHECHMLCIQSPRVPATQLARLAGCPCVYHPVLGGFLPRYDPRLALHGPAARVYAAGDLAGVDSPRAAAESGRLAARCALGDLGVLPEAEARIAEARQRLSAASYPLHARAREALMIGAVPDEVIERLGVPDDTVVCPCEGVTVGALRAAVEDGARTTDDLGRWTRCGMGPCQWRRCGEAVMRWLSGVLDVPIGRMPLPSIRPPVRPIPLAAIAGIAPAPSAEDHA
jgi:bacterioferritin-associated ferredoxin